MPQLPTWLKSYTVEAYPLLLYPLSCLEGTTNGRLKEVFLRKFTVACPWSKKVERSEKELFYKRTLAARNFVAKKDLYSISAGYFTMTLPLSTLDFKQELFRTVRMEEVRTGNVFASFGVSAPLKTNLPSMSFIAERSETNRTPAFLFEIKKDLTRGLHFHQGRG